MDVWIDEGHLRRVAAVGVAELVAWRFDAPRMIAQADAWSLDSYYREATASRAASAVAQRQRERAAADLAANLEEHLAAHTARRAALLAAWAARDE